ncbi:hypothetical protein E2P81_ATG06735 [Venturia nashicola]|uniref:Maintenance of mitochondrial morphology protein 1 n=1 Tax=Venturia nashicola TaxID=86259 RepID=A0A4Z1P5N8_9PEZI|nr:hypothetical protein E6O75_ATG06906 [Venturia nashicola]TLD30082.1 hypothetical protein E2P81_ATG06735 [Venturia nashicola]
MNALLAFFLGQLTLALLIFAFIKFFIFGDPPPPSHLVRPRTPSSSGRLNRKKSSLLRPQLPTTAENILAKTYYNVKGHQPESLDWFNVLVAQTIAQLRADAHHDDAILKSLNDVMNGGQRPDFIGDVRVTEINLGEEYPIFSNCRVIPVEEEDGLGGPRLQARLDVDLADCITLGVETKLVLNYPKRLVAVLPVALAVNVLSLSFIPAAHPSSGSDSEDQSSSPTTLSFSFLPDYRLDLSVRSLVGSRARLQDVPKIAQLVEARIHQWFDERCVEPRVQQIVLPSLWPRKKNTRGPEDPASDEEEGDESMLEDTPLAKTKADTPVEDSLEARMSEEGKILRQADGRGPIDETPTKNPETLRRRPLHRAMNSMQGIRLPGGFSY